MANYAVHQKQQDEDNENLWHFSFIGPAQNGNLRLASTSQEIGEGGHAGVWLQNNQEFADNLLNDSEIPVLVLSGYGDQLQRLDLDNEADAWELIRQERNRRLDEMDYTQLPDATILPGVKIAIASYRSQLKAIPDAPSVMDHVFPVRVVVPGDDKRQWRKFDRFIRQQP